MIVQVKASLIKCMGLVTTITNFEGLTKQF